MIPAYLISKNKSDLELVRTKGAPHIEWFDGNGYESFSELINSVVLQCPSEKLIIMSHKVTPHPVNFELVSKMLDVGYGLVGLYRLAFFGINKEMFRRVGPFDERFRGGTYEDRDYFMRMVESNIAFYLTHEVPYRTAESTWANGIHEYKNMSRRNEKLFLAKWNGQERLLPENDHGYDFGPSVEQDFLPSRKSWIKFDYDTVPTGEEKTGLTSLRNLRHEGILDDY